MSSSRGYFLGQIVDDLDAIAHQVDNRSQLGLVDLNRLLEDFVKDVLNIVLDAELENLNATRSNEPGLDLGDQRKRIAFQVTSSRKSAKINKTLEALSAEQLAAYEKFYVLIIGSKQSSYKLANEAATRARFTEENIWDVGDLCRRATHLSLTKLQELHQLVSAEVTKVRVELEIPRADGSYPTSLDNFIERPVEPVRSDASVFFNEDDGEYANREEAAADLGSLADALAELPRISREFFAFLISKRETVVRFSHYYRTNADLVTRLSRYPDTKGELRFLSDRGFISYDEPDDHMKSGNWRLHLPIAKQNRHFDDAFFGFLDRPGIDLKRIIVQLDFSAFGVDERLSDPAKPCR